VAPAARRGCSDGASRGGGEVDHAQCYVVEVRAAGINACETLIRAGALHEMFPERFPATFPSGEGNDLADVVTAVRADVRRFSVGDEVLGYGLRPGSHASHTAVPVVLLTRTCLPN
jgi:NADPH2:quinone reductase